jgi:hypothetical protein
MDFGAASTMESWRRWLHVCLGHGNSMDVSVMYGDTKSSRLLLIK